MPKLPHPNIIVTLLQKALNDLPPLPAAVSRVLLESQKSDVSAHRLEEIISTDPALAAKVLRVVNSAYYGLPGQIHSLGQACVILGVTQIRNLTLSMGAMSVAAGQTQTEKEILHRFWRHSFGSATTAQRIARGRGFSISDEEQVFVGALLHDIGRLFLAVRFPDIYAAIMDRSAAETTELYEAELKILQLTHAQLGGRMAQAWGLPASLCSMIEGHEGPFEVGASPLIMAVHLGDALNDGAYGMLVAGEEGSDPIPTPPRFDSVALAWFNGTESEWEDIRAATLEKIEASEESYGAMAA